eukprot:3063001-Rhodomonas_salina.1
MSRMCAWIMTGSCVERSYWGVVLGAWRAEGVVLCRALCACSLQANSTFCSSSSRVSFLRHEGPASVMRVQRQSRGSSVSHEGPASVSYATAD